MLRSTKSEFNVEVVRVGAISKHPNADSLSMTEVNGNPVIFRTGDYTEGQLAVYVPADAIPPAPEANEHLAFLKGERVKAKRLRGVFSCGLLVPMAALRTDPNSAAEYRPGDDVAQALGITKYLTPAERAELTAEARAEYQKKTGSKKDPGFMPVYGLDPLKRFRDIIKPGDEVVLTEKIHGCNARYCFRGGRLYVGSHKTMRGVTRSRLAEAWDRVKLRVKSALGIRHRASLIQNLGDVWWEAAEKYDLRNKLAQYPDLVFYGEIYGHKVQDLVYDAPTERKFRVFDIYNLKTGRYLEYDDVWSIARVLGLRTPPELYRGPWNEGLMALKEGASPLNPDHTREGFVVRPIPERHEMGLGRVSLKCVGEGYLLRKGA